MEKAEELKDKIEKYFKEHNVITDEYDDFGNVKVNTSRGTLFMRAEDYHKLMQEAFKEEINKANGKNK
jgi:hypothetical protein